MTKVIHLPSPRAGTRNAPGVQTCVPSTIDPSPNKSDVRSPLDNVFKGRRSPHLPDAVSRQQAIENALSMALYFIRQPGDMAANVWAATARTNRALTLLKQASEGNALASPANTLGRA